MANQLSASAGSGTQTSTQSPQSSAGSGSFGGQQSSGVQPGTASNLLTSSGGGTPLQPTALSTVNLSAAPASTTQTAVADNPPKHHANPALFGISALFVVIAVMLFWSVSRATKNTTDY